MQEVKRIWSKKLPRTRKKMTRSRKERKRI